MIDLPLQRRLLVAAAILLCILECGCGTRSAALPQSTPVATANAAPRTKDQLARVLLSMSPEERVDYVKQHPEYAQLPEH